MPRPREPVNLLIAKGRKHLTKAEIEKRRESEVQAPVDGIEAPAYLTPELQEEFNKIATQLADIGIMTNLDIDTLARFIIAREIYIKLSMQIVKQPAVLMSAKFPQIAINQDKAFKQCSAAARDLGMTISSRCKLVIPKHENEENDPNAELFG